MDEREAAARLFHALDEVADVAEALPRDDVAVSRLETALAELLDRQAPIRPVVAADLLAMSEKTVRNWVAHGLLITVASPRRLLLDPVRVFEVHRVVDELRAAGQDRELLDATWHRLSDKALLDRDDLRASLEQMQLGRGRKVRGPS